MSALAAVWRPLDRARRVLLVAGGPVTLPLVRSREARVAVLAMLAIACSLAATLVAPLWLLALSPLAIGVPHLVGDVRYLVARPRLHRRRAWLVAVVPPLGVVALGGGARAGLIAVVTTALVARGPSLRRVAVAGIGAGLCALAWRAGRTADLIAAHAHNLLGVALWWAWRPRARPWHWIPLAAFALACAALVALPVEDLVARWGGLARSPSAAIDLPSHVAWLVGDGVGVYGVRLVLCFAFAQAVHYAVWTRLVPEDDRGRETPRTFVASWRALEEDLGVWPLRVAIAVAVALAVWACVDLAAARDGYFRLALFHGYLELAVATLWLVEGRRR